MTEEDKMPKPKEVVVVDDDQKKLFSEALALTDELSDDISKVGTPIREWALAHTKLEEAMMWLELGFVRLGIEPDETSGDSDSDDEDGDDDDDDDDDDGTDGDDGDADGGGDGEEE